MMIVICEEGLEDSELLTIIEPIERVDILALAAWAGALS